MKVFLMLVLTVFAGGAFAGFHEIVPAQQVSRNSPQNLSGQLAVATGSYDPDNGSGIDEYHLVAVTTGNAVALHIFDPILETLTLTDEISVATALNPFNIRFMELDVNTSTVGTEHCLVIPCYSATLSEGEIYIYDLENRDLYDDCLVWNMTQPTKQVYSVNRIVGDGTSASDIYALSIDNSIRLASFILDNGQPKFSIYDDQMTFQPSYYASMSQTALPRAFETFDTFQYNAETYVLTTCHNGGVLLWKPIGSTLGPEEVSWMRVGQWGGSGSTYGNPTMVDGELGDIHRGVVLYRTDGQPSLLFAANHTMGMMVFDIYPGDGDVTPDFVWQWDNDSRLIHSEYGETVWDWHGPGDGTTIPQNNDIPGCSFGIGLYTNSISNMIHVYLAGGHDGLRVFDFSNFFSPFGTMIPSSMFKSFDVLNTVKYRNEDAGGYYCAHDLRTLDINGYNRFVFTTWRENKSDQTGEILVSVHEDQLVSRDSGSSGTSSGVGNLSLGLSGANPSPASVSLQITSSSRTGEISIHDMTGRMVLTEQLEISNGSATWTWDGNTHSGQSAPSGVYFYRLTDPDGGSVTIRSTLIR